jgi:hypothetical protein
METANNLTLTVFIVFLSFLRQIDWFCGRVAPMHLGLMPNAVSSFHQLQRRSTPRMRQRPLLAREEIGREMADLI